MGSLTTVRAADIAGHPAVTAWDGLGLGHATPESIEILRRKKKSGVYRLVGAGPGGSTVIAKRCRRDIAHLERTIYAEILPRLGNAALQCFGCAEESPGERCWLFLEDAGGKEHKPDLERHRVLVSRWLGLLHTGAARLDAAARLPDRGAGHYLQHLQSSRESILRQLDHPLLSAADRSVLQSIGDQCSVLEGRWPEIERFCDGIPRTLVHGDLGLGHMRVRATGGVSEVLVFDWETAGWGVPAPDLAQLRIASAFQADLPAYWSTVRESWPGLGLADLRQLAAVGTLFRLLAIIRWETVTLPDASLPKTMASMRIYQTEMARALQAAGWASADE